MRLVSNFTVFIKTVTLSSDVSVSFQGKMRHLMELLRKEFQDPTNVSTCSADPDKKETRLFEAFHSHLESRGKEPKGKDDLLSYTSFINSYDSIGPKGHPFVSTPGCSPERTVSPSVINDDYQEENALDNVLSNTGSDDGDSHQREMGTNATDGEISGESPKDGEREFNQEGSMGCSDEQAELRGLEGQFSKSLHVSSSPHRSVSEQHEGSSSDSEFWLEFSNIIL